ncbi:MAG: hypothetical protein KF777_13835 [Planctomycetaceae bacterium]|nr:hypothetical protein [Planctomycetaceae bacterium]
MSHESRVFEFTLWLADDARDHAEWSEALYEAGGDDMLVGVLAGKPYVGVHRRAESLEAAIRSARDTVQQAGLQVVKCEIEPEVIANWS